MNELEKMENVVEVTTYENDGGMLSNDTIFALAEQAEKRVASINKIMSAALKITNENDWTIIGGTPYLQESGASKVRALFGISIKMDAIDKEVRPDGHYVYTYRGTFTMSGVTIEAIGARSSNDEFFTGKEKTKDDGTVIKPKTAEEIDVRDVKLAAYTNFINNGIKRILPGLRNLRMEDLKVAGLDTDKMKGYGFNNSASKEMDSEALDMKNEILKMLLDVSGGDESAAKNSLANFTGFTGRDGNEVKGHGNINKISEKAMPVVYGKVKKAYDAWLKQQKSEGMANDGQVTE